MENVQTWPRHMPQAVFHLVAGLQSLNLTCCRRMGERVWCYREVEALGHFGYIQLNIRISATNKQNCLRENKTRYVISLSHYNSSTNSMSLASSATKPVCVSITQSGTSFTRQPFFIIQLNFLSQEYTSPRTFKGSLPFWKFRLLLLPVCATLRRGGETAYFKLCPSAELLWKCPE